MEVNLQDFSGEYLYSVAAMFSAGAYLLRSTLWLRILLVMAAIVYIMTGVSLGITSMVGWNSTYLLINLAHIVLLMPTTSQRLSGLNWYGHTWSS